MIQCKCGQCGGLMQVDDSGAETIQPCPTCGANIQIPQQGAAPAPQPVSAALPAYSAAGSRRSSPGLFSLTGIVALLALAAGVTALVLVLLRPAVPGDGMGAYDFSSPEAAVRSMLEIEINADILASMQMAQLRQLNDNEDERAQLKSLSIDSVHTYQGKSLVLFKTTDSDNDTNYGARWFEEVEGKYCRAREPKDFEKWDEEDADSKKGKIYKAMREWQRQSRE